MTSLSATPLILASASQHRAMLLKSAGLKFTLQAAHIEERTIEEPLLKASLEPADIARILAEAKAKEVSERFPDALVIGCDQTLSLEERMFHKPRDMKDARQHLLAFSGKSHQLNSGIVLVKNGETLWRHVAIANMSVRQLDPGYIGRYLAKIGDKAMTSVGAYQIEGEGINLFDNIEGDTFTIIGLPLLPLLAKLREMDIIDG